MAEQTNPNTNDEHPVIPGLTPRRRKWIYGIVLGLAPIAILHGLMTGEQAALYVAAIVAFLSSGVALPNIHE